MAKKAKKNGKKLSARPAGELRIRMYRVGFGDFFLITVPTADGPQHILLDCGVTRGKSQKGDIATIKAAVRHMASETNSKLALVIVTHRHQDHIIGFSRSADVFSRFQIGAIWMPVWETQYASEVEAFQDELQSMASSLAAAALAGEADDSTDAVLAMVENATGVAATEKPGGGTNARSLEMLKHGFGVEPEYFSAGDTAHLPASMAAAGLQATILGPPPLNELDFLALEDLKKGIGQYIAAAPGKRVGEKLMPFEPAFVVGADRYPPSAFREFAPRSPGVPPDPHARHDRQLEQAVRSATPEALFIAAKKLDDMLNNQSLVVLFDWNGKKLLFAGDAQGGNWEYWMYGCDAPQKDPTGLRVTDESRSILESLAFYKVSHHGSTNATPIPAVQAMGSGFTAMCSVEPGAFGKESNDSEIPRIPLMDALREKCSMVRSDQIAVKVESIDLPAAVQETMPSPRKGRIVAGSCYVDYFL